MMKIKYPWGYVLGLVTLVALGLLMWGLLKWLILPNLLFSALGASLAINIVILLPMCERQVRALTLGYWRAVLRALKGGEYLTDDER